MDFLDERRVLGGNIQEMLSERAGLAPTAHKRHQLPAPQSNGAGERGVRTRGYFDLFASSALRILSGVIGSSWNRTPIAS